MSDAWEEIQAVKSKRNSLREKLEKRKKERQIILSTNANLVNNEKSEGSPGGGKERSTASPASHKIDGTAINIVYQVRNRNIVMDSLIDINFL